VSASCPAPAPSALLGAGLHLNQLSRFPGPPQSDQVKRLKELEAENLRLRRAISDLTLDKLILQEAARGNY
jgi:hypothetical protein